MIVLRTLDGQEISFMLPSLAAEALGRALIQQGRHTAPPHRVN